ncbi:D-alanine-D-alanine ligase-like ATP-grasp enzyme [Dysgonomonas sp. PFB1-18]|uniref:hypothetical protein n=1 Tax=unclassified Dysgonomonas TaxID=2630389 RepID=UPI0013D73AE4|nr:MULTISPECIES: hypothetical protein [unclassified Dysgonomonas]MDH6310076.1 D-alanine-D-alanine ligase-like ATP-grasp enzyme [Dysgonomonas sp. PF1-14]MDH6339985.1 D-alanine-D-alanine ligase-like ATP-grasp enzyme [Dysgonomonas sp. PF1-16]MDH6381633.1 D-alanine-D-alanine ligase-like ATP-grasp enzyme [Dysgonomonas sp. PFB1-18]MDH6398729.1 D-alanine-D-alanine ligase-like ATP-grasp enzyme [Dysgonomonas sp. PF1-23]NDV93576.1 hypothetical protein [Dysgonomonas sp. 521]
MNNYLNQRKSIRGKFIGIIYSFEGESSPGSEHYDVWRSDVISDWLKAIQEIGCIPYILDVRTFAYKAFNKSLPPLDFIVNLNAGNCELSMLGLVPSICGFLAIPCIPCDTLTAVSGENKILSNLIAFAKGFNVPEEIDSSDSNGIFRLCNLGSSCGVKKGFGQTETNYTYQKFIQGFDLTIPILYNPLTNELEVLPGILYIPDNRDTQWFLGEQEKEHHSGYKKEIAFIDHVTKEKCVDLAKSFFIQTFCRIDTRIYCKSFDELTQIINNIPFNRVFFLEINPMPTIRNGINFHNSLEYLDYNSSMNECLQLYREDTPNSSLTGFILSNSIIALTTKH